MNPSKPQGASATRHSDRRRQVIDAAATVFRQKGYDAASLQDIADAVGIQKGSLYHYIEKKEDLLFAIVEETHDGTLRGNSRWETMDGDALTRLRTFIEDHARVSMRYGNYASIYFRDARALSSERSAQIMSARDRYEAGLRSMIEEAQSEGAVAPELDAQLATFAVFGMVNWLYQWYRPSGALTPDAIARGLADLAMASLTCTPSASS